MQAYLCAATLPDDMEQRAQRAYQCPECDMWHLTKSKQRG